MFEWDDEKSSRNHRERGLPFDLAMALFDGPTLEIDDRRRDYGERRINVLGEIRGRIFACTYTWRGSPEAPVRRIISLRKAHKGEAHAYRKTFPG